MQALDLFLLSAPLFEPPSLQVNYAELDNILEEEETTTLSSNWVCDCTINLTHKSQLKDSILYLLKN